MELTRLYVDTQLQGRGIGKQLIHAALNDKAMKEAANIYLQVWEENHIAIKLYERFGFELKETNLIPTSPVKHYSMVREPK